MRYFGKLNSNLQKIVESNNYQLESDDIEMFEPRPDSDYIANSDGEWVLKIANTEEQLTTLDAEYQTQFDVLVAALGTATLANDTDLIADLQTEYTALKAEYTAVRSVIENG